MNSNEETGMMSCIKQPIAIHWKILEEELKEKIEENGFLDSRKFCIANSSTKYFLRLYPNGGTDETKRGKCWIFFYLQFEEPKDIKAKFSITVGDTCLSKKKEWKLEKSGGLGCEMCASDDLLASENSFFVDGEMILKFEGAILLQKNLKKLEIGGDGDQLCIDLWNQDNKDFTIIVQDQKIEAHKLILSTRSPVFAAMFKPNTKEAKKNEVTIEEFPFEAVEAAIKFCYHHSLVKPLSIPTLISVLRFFDKYFILSLKNDLEEYFISIIDGCSICSLIKGANMANASKLEKKCMEYLANCFKTGEAVNSFGLLDKDFIYELFKNGLHSSGWS